MSAGRPRAERQRQIVADQQRRDADPNRAELGVTEQQRLPELEVRPCRCRWCSSCVERAAATASPVAARRQRLAFERGIGVGHGDVVRVGDGGKRDVLGVEAGFEDRPQAGIAAQRLRRIAPSATTLRARDARWRWPAARRASRLSSRLDPASRARCIRLRTTTTVPTIDVTPRTCLPLIPRRIVEAATSRGYVLSFSAGVAVCSACCAASSG